MESQPLVSSSSHETKKERRLKILAYFLAVAVAVFMCATAGLDIYGSIDYHNNIKSFKNLKKMSFRNFLVQ